MVMQADPAKVVLPRTPKGKRPAFFEDPSVDQLMTFVLELTTEVGVMPERLDTVEHLLERDGKVTRASIEAFQPSTEMESERNAWRDAYLKRVFRLHSTDSSEV